MIKILASLAIFSTAQWFMFGGLPNGSIHTEWKPASIPEKIHWLIGQ